MNKRMIATRFAWLALGIAALGATQGWHAPQAEAEFVAPAEGTVAWCGWMDAWGEDARCAPVYEFAVNGLSMIAQYPDGEVTHRPEVTVYEDGAWTYGAWEGCLPVGLCND